MIYRRRPSPLHAARAVVGTVWMLAIMTAALALQHPLALGALIAGVLVAGHGALVGAPVWRAFRWAVPFALLIVAVNALASRQGVTVIWRFDLGLGDVTLEAVLVGASFGLTSIVILCAAALHVNAVDPDDLLRAFRRLSFHSALTAALATRMVGVLVRDGRRMADAQRCLAGAPAPRLALVRAVSTNAMDRALDVAATLEVRGYGTAGRAPALRRAWSRHDVAFSASAAVLVALALVGTPFDDYPRFEAPLDARAVAVAVAAFVAVVAPFASRRGVE